MFIVGSMDMLGNWDPNNGIKLSWSEGHKWSIVINMSKLKDKNVEFKFIVKNVNSGDTKWEGGQNHSLNWTHLQSILNSD